VPKPEADDDMARQHLDLAIPIPPTIGYLFQETRWQTKMNQAQ
jgi:hypothetical protein